jgi:hypothetical protein
MPLQFAAGADGLRHASRTTTEPRRLRRLGKRKGGFIGVVSRGAEIEWQRRGFEFSEHPRRYLREIRALGPAQ